jgi:hypothetical protein
MKILRIINKESKEMAKPKLNVKEVKFSFFQEMMLQVRNLQYDMSTGKLKKVSFTFEKGIYLLRLEYA